MAETPSTMLPLGTPALPLRLADAVTGRVVDAAETARGKKGLLVAFICKKPSVGCNIKWRPGKPLPGSVDRQEGAGATTLRARAAARR